jgi:hypothetical protein
MKFSAKPLVIVVAGNSGSGKSSFVVRLFLNGKFSVRFIFDPRGEYATRFKRRPCKTAAELLAAIPTGYVIFDPSFLFPGNVDLGFEKFCEFVHFTSGKCSGQKIMFVDEVWKHCSPNKIPLALAQIVQDGRKNELGLITSTQRPNRINEAIMNECNELVCFRLRGANALDFVTSYDSEFPVHLLPNLPPLHLIGRNLDTGGERRGIVKL